MKQMQVGRKLEAMLKPKVKMKKRQRVLLKYNLD